PAGRREGDRQLLAVGPDPDPAGAAGAGRGDRRRDRPAGAPPPCAGVTTKGPAPRKRGAGLSHVGLMSAGRPGRGPPWAGRAARTPGRRATSGPRTGVPARPRPPTRTPAPAPRGPAPPPPAPPATSDARSPAGRRGRAPGSS